MMDILCVKIDEPYPESRARPNNIFAHNFESKIPRNTYYFEK